MDQKQQRRKVRVSIRTEQIMSLCTEGYDVVCVGGDRYRINKLLDVFLIHKEYLDLKRQERGYYSGSVKDFIRQYLAIRPVMIFEPVYETPPPTPPQDFWSRQLMKLPKFKEFFGSYNYFLKLYEERKLARLNTKTQIGQQFLKAINQDERRIKIPRKKQKGAVLHGEGS